MTSRTTHNRVLGAHGESLAGAYLEQRGLRILARNWRSRHGELDVIALDRGTLVAVEVKTRRGTGYGHPLEAITARKADRLRRLLHAWRRESGFRSAPMRIDAVGITLQPGGDPRIEHLRGIS